MPIHIKGSGGIVKQGTQEAPSIVVNDSGLITATAGGLSATHQLTTQSGQTITPNINNQIIPNGRYLTGDQIIEGDENLKSSNIKSGVSIFGIDGELDVGITLPSLNNPGSAADLRSGKELIDANGNTITGSVTSRTSSSVTTSNNVVTIPAGIYDSQVQKTVGTAKSAATYIPGTSDQTISSGYYLTGAQTIKGDSNLVASNIKSGVSIFGVSGSLADGWQVLVFSTFSDYPSDPMIESLTFSMSKKKVTFRFTQSVTEFKLLTLNGFDENGYSQTSFIAAPPNPECLNNETGYTYQYSGTRGTYYAVIENSFTENTSGTPAFTHHVCFDNNDAFEADGIENSDYCGYIAVKLT